MKVSFAPGVAPDARVVARLMAQDAFPADLDATLREAAGAGRFTGKAGQVFEGFTGSGTSFRRTVLAGLGDLNAANGSGNAAERAGAALTARFLTSGEGSLTIDFTGTSLSADDAALVLLGAVLRGWRHDVYRTKLSADQKPSLTEIVGVAAPAGTQAAWEAESAIAAGVALTRELVTEPANVIFPESFVARCQDRFAGTGVDIEVLDKAAMTALGMGALLGVAQGSIRDPRLLVLHWKGTEGKPTAFVGKGVTFDTGGISLKPPAGMEDMKWDMGGAGAVAGAMLALALRKAKANIVGVCGLVENMPDAGAQRPGDVVTSMSGQTVEVINTDAEGRLVLCDALTWVQKNHAPARIVDLATLTGAIMVSLGNEHAGIFSNDDALAGELVAAGAAVGEKLWRMPIGAAYDKLIDSPIADMKNVGPRNGGSITAAQFLARYIEKDDAGKATPWAHLDIAGTVWADKPGLIWDKGATGYGVRLLDRFVRDNLEG